MSDYKRTVSLVTAKSGQDSTKVNFPADLSRALKAGGYTHAEISVLKEGILVKPIKLKHSVARHDDVADIPNW